MNWRTVSCHAHGPLASPGIRISGRPRWPCFSTSTPPMSKRSAAACVKAKRLGSWGDCAKAGTAATFDEVLANELKEAKLEKVVDSKKVNTFVPSARVVEVKGGGNAAPKRYQPNVLR